jgi:type VI secretion system protein ImpG
MQDDLLLYYERELTYLRKLGAEFAQRYPKVASRLQLEASKTEDPHVERLLEGFAFLAARVHRRLDDDFPEISESLLEVLHPHLVRPVPSMCIVDMPLDPAQGRVPNGFRVKRGSTLHSRPVQGVPCIFRTSYDTTIWPLRVSAAEWTTPDRAAPGVRVRDAVGAIRLEIQAYDGMKLKDLTMDALRLHLAGDSAVADTLYELLMNNNAQVVVRNPERQSQPPVLLGTTCIKALGFEADELMLPFPTRAFAGYSLLLELFTFPEKFHFVEVSGFGEALRSLGATSRGELTFIISQFERADRRPALELGISAKSFRTAAVPAVNLFEETAEPILLTERAFEHLVVADARRRLETEVWSIDTVKLVEHGASTVREVAPLYSHKHGAKASDNEIFWHATRRASEWRTDRGTDLHLTFMDLSGEIREPDVDVASLKVTCFNGDLPSRLPFGVDERGDFELVGGGPVPKILSVVNPTRSVQPALGSPLLWRMISSLSLNHLSISDGTPNALQELLRLHNVSNSLSADQRIDGLIGVRGTPSFARVASEHGVAFARGRKIALEFDEEKYPGGGMFLFASVLERFLALYTSMNSFTQVTVHSRQRRRQVVEWPPRAGWRALL